MKQTSEQTILIPGPAGQIETILATPTHGSKPITAIICHPHPLHGGTMRNKVISTLHRTLSDLDITTVRFNFRGIGHSTGTYDNAVGEVSDLDAVYQWVKTQYPTREIWVLGFSFGSYIASVFANFNDVQRLVAVAPPVHHYDFAALGQISCPWIIIQGDQDEIVPTHMVREWQQSLAIPTTYIEIADASHFFHGKLIELREKLTEALL